VTKKRTSKVSARPAATFKPPYAPSWFDRLTAWIDRLPIPPWVVYLLVAAGLSIALTAIQWGEGAYPFGAFYYSHVWTACAAVYIVALMHYLDNVARAAMTSFAPLLPSTHTVAQQSGEDAPTCEVLSYQLTTLPPRPALLFTIAGAAFATIAYALDLASGSPSPYLAGTVSTTLSIASVMAVFIPANGLVFLLAYHTVHQLALISRIYSEHARINIYQLHPLYALSRPTAFTAIGIILFVYSLFTIAPEQAAENPIQIGLTIGLAAIALATFAWPLLGAHRRLVAAKETRLAEVASRFEAITVKLHNHLDHNRLLQMDQLNKALATLEIEQNAVRKIPTWPWQPGSVRGVVAALLLPIAIWAIQVLLGRLFGV
jgi:hypothetical protein